MKKQILLTLLLCLSLFLFGCDNNAKESAVTEEQTAATEETAAPTETEENTETAAAEVPDDENMETIFNEAYEVYQWFELEQLEMETNADGSVKMYDIDGTTCGKVEDERISSYEELKAAVESRFSSEISRRLLENGLYLEHEGELYEVLADRGGDITRGEIISQGVTLREESAITYTVTVETVDPAADNVTGSEELNFRYENIDGTWLFTEFQSIY